MTCPDATLYLYAPRERWLALLADGWELPFVVAPMPGGHGHHSILLSRSPPRLFSGLAGSPGVPSDPLGQ